MAEQTHRLSPTYCRVLAVVLVLIALLAIGDNLVLLASGQGFVNSVTPTWSVERVPEYITLFVCSV
ncbi:MAG: hypothetical protein MUD01_20710 [Chloroflexaceae bacterium]|jgi:hypothetical protein|nr:hypothetical protein [Chloroflexaceae bacterium]